MLLAYPLLPRPALLLCRTPRPNTAAVNLNILWGVSIVDVGAIVFAPSSHTSLPLRHSLSLSLPLFLPRSPSLPHKPLPSTSARTALCVCVCLSLYRVRGLSFVFEAKVISN